MRGTIIALTAFLAITTGASAWYWPNDTVPVYDYTTTWDGVWEEDITAFNALGVIDVPTLIYHREESTPCDKVKRHRGAIVVCENANLPLSGQTSVRGVGRNIVSAKIVVDSAHPNFRQEALNTACHEMVHALTNAPDHYNSAPYTSCIYGSLTYPGPTDRQLLHHAYDHPKKQRKHRH